MCRPNNRGVILIWMAVLALLLVGIGGLALDAAHVYFVGHQLQIGADSAARAGAFVVHRPAEDVREFAKSVALRNMAGNKGVELEDTDVEIGRYTSPENGGLDGTFTVTDDAPNAVRVTARRTEGSPGGGVDTFFGQIFGVRSVNTGRLAIAVQKRSAGNGLIVLHSTAPCSLSMNSNARITVRNGGLQINSAALRALCMRSNARIYGDPVNVTGAAYLRGNASISGALNEGAAALSDPLGNLPNPVPGPDLGQIKLTSNQTRTIDPGYYSGGFRLDSNSSLYLNPGIYILDGEGLHLRSNTSLIGEGVSIYVKNDKNPDSTIHISSNGRIELTPPNSGPYRDVVLWQSRTNTNDVVIRSNGWVDIAGAVYIPSTEATLYMHSNGQVIGNAVLAHRIHLDSNARVVIDDMGLFGSPTGSYLVR